MARALSQDHLESVVVRYIAEVSEHRHRREPREFAGVRPPQLFSSSPACPRNGFVDIDGPIQVLPPVSYVASVQRKAVCNRVLDPQIPVKDLWILEVLHDARRGTGNGVGAIRSCANEFPKIGVLTLHGMGEAGGLMFKLVSVSIPPGVVTTVPVLRFLRVSPVGTSCSVVCVLMKCSTQGCSYMMLKPARTTVVPLPVTSQANPRRGAKSQGSIL